MTSPRAMGRRGAIAGMPAMALVAALIPLAVGPIGATAAAAREPARSYIVTLDVPDAGAAIDPAGRRGRERVRQRARRTRGSIARLESEHGFEASQRYTFALSGFGARLTRRQAAAIAGDPGVASVRPARRYRMAAQTVPAGVQRTKAAPLASPGADVDADVAVLDTGIGPVGGGELNVQGGINCSGDSLGKGAWEDHYPSRHGTHVAGTIGARDNGVGAVGVAPGARLWSVRVFRDSGYGDEASVICGLDWAVATLGPDPPAGSQPIEVVNMSLEGPRPAGDPESCDARPVPDPDPMHLAVCAASAAGISVVVAAGNDASNARTVSPAGYDQVVTVGAISDFDGRPGSGSSPTCASTPFGPEVDDSYARYSNHGVDVDILAPGTCVVSTFPSGSGDATQRLTGTSMATPHVAGALARYLAANPGMPPERLNRLVRAAGRLDWEVSSDPDWAGPTDAGAPDRLLDVSALVGPEALRVWVIPSRLTAAGRATGRHARAEIQRGGGYDRAVQLAVEELPAAAGSVTFAPAGNLSGLAGLGAQLTFRLPHGGLEGRFDLAVKARGEGGGPVGSRDLELLVDRSGPDIGDLRASLVGSRTSLGRSGSAMAHIVWTADDALVQVRRNELQRRIGRKAWTTVAVGSDGLTRAGTRLTPGRDHAFRVKSTDRLGNTSVSRPLPLHLTVRDSSSDKWLRPVSAWKTATDGRAVGDSVLATREAKSSLSTEFTGSAVAIVAPIGPGHGEMRVRLDGGDWQIVELRAARKDSKRVVFSRRLKAGDHTFEIQARDGLVAVDALLILR